MTRSASSEQTPAKGALVPSRGTRKTMRQLSSSMTSFYKFVFPTVWIGAFASVTLLMFIAPDSFKGNGDVHEMRWQFAFAMAVGGGFIYWACMRLKTVR